VDRRRRPERDLTLMVHLRKCSQHYMQNIQAVCQSICSQINANVDIIFIFIDQIKYPHYGTQVDLNQARIYLLILLCTTEVKLIHFSCINLFS